MDIMFVEFYIFFSLYIHFLLFIGVCYVNDSVLYSKLNLPTKLKKINIIQYIWGEQNIYWNKKIGAKLYGKIRLKKTF